MITRTQGRPSYPRYAFDVVELAARIRLYRRLKEFGEQNKASITNVGTMYWDQTTLLNNIFTTWFNDAMAMIKLVRGVNNGNAIYEIDPIDPPDPYLDDFAPTQEPIASYAASGGLSPLGGSKLLGGGLLKGGGGGGLLPPGGGPLPLPRPRPWPRPRPRPWPWPPWPPFPPAPDPLFWRPSAEQDYSYVYAFKSLLDIEMAKTTWGRDEFRYVAYFAIGLFQHYYELFIYVRTHALARTMCVQSIANLRAALK